MAQRDSSVFHHRVGVGLDSRIASSNLRLTYSPFRFAELELLYGKSKFNGDVNNYKTSTVTGEYQGLGVKITPQEFIFKEAGSPWVVSSFVGGRFMTGNTDIILRRKFNGDMFEDYTYTEAYENISFSYWELNFGMELIYSDRVSLTFIPVVVGRAKTAWIERLKPESSGVQFKPSYLPLDGRKHPFSLGVGITFFILK